MAKKNKKENKKGGTDPKAAALAFLNINLGSKNINTKSRKLINVKESKLVGKLVFEVFTYIKWHFEPFRRKEDLSF